MIKILRQKHPDAKPSNYTMMFYGPFSEVNEIIFDGINAGLVTNCAIRTKGSHGSSGLDADFWSKILCNSTFGNASDDLCHAIALLARMLCSEELEETKSIEGLVAACRLIPLDKSPGAKTNWCWLGIATYHWQSHSDSVNVGYTKRYWLPTIMRRFRIRMQSSSSYSSGSFCRRYVTWIHSDRRQQCLYFDKSNINFT